MRRLDDGRWVFDTPTAPVGTARTRNEYRSRLQPRLSREQAEALEAIERAFGGPR